MCHGLPKNRSAAEFLDLGRASRSTGRWAWQHGALGVAAQGAGRDSIGTAIRTRSTYDCLPRRSWQELACVDMEYRQDELGCDGIVDHPILLSSLKRPGISKQAVYLTDRGPQM